MGIMINFQEWSDMGVPASYYQAKSNLLDRINITDGMSKALQLERILNNIINHNRFQEEKVAQKIFAKIDSVVQRGGQKGLEGLSVDSKFKVSTSESTAAWQKYMTLYNRFKQDKEGLENDVAFMNDMEKARKRALEAQGRINTIQGDALEAFVEIALPVIADIVAQKGEDAVNDIISAMIKNVNNITTASPIKTQGAVSESCIFQFGEEWLKISSQGKTDVSAPAPFLGDDFLLSASIKNYSKLKDVSALGSGSVIALVANWPGVGSEDQKYIYNAFTIYDPSNAVPKIAEELFGIQSVAGRGDSQMSNFLILNIRANKNPIRVIPVRMLLEYIFKEGNDLTDYFIFKYNPEIPLFKGVTDMRSEESVSQRVKSLNLTTILRSDTVSAKMQNALKAVSASV